MSSTPEPSRMDPKHYYDQFSTGYEDERHHGYHALVDELEARLAADYGQGLRVLEAGCGTGMILKEVVKSARRAVGVDLSSGMLHRAHGRGLPVAQASVTALPFADASFDVVCSFKVLAHVPEIRSAVAEAARVTVPGGVMLLEFYNPRSLRYLAKRLTRPGRIAEAIDESAVYTRFDTEEDIRSYLPAGVTLVTFRGIRVVSPGAFLYRVPGLANVFARAERWATQSPLSRFGGFLVAVMRKDL